MSTHLHNRSAFLKRPCSQRCSMSSMVFVLAIGIASVATAQTAEETWAKLRGPERKVTAVYQLPERDPKLPNVFIYGDSISIHYTPRVREVLAGKANVYRFYGNGNHSGRFIPAMTKMHTAMRDKNVEGHWDFKWDAIHLNVGIHDLKYVRKKQMNPPSQYEKNLRAIFEFLEKTEPDAKIIFASTTPLPARPAGNCKPGDSAAYNEVVKKVLKDYPKVILNDLYALTKPNPDWFRKPADAHFGQEGCHAQGEQVAARILEALNHRKRQTPNQTDTP